MKPKALLIGLVLILPIAMISCDDDNGNSQGTVTEELQANDDLSQLASLLEDQGLVDALEGDGPYTIFAPTNAAFEQISDVTGSLSDDQLSEVLSYHVLQGNVMSSDLDTAQKAASLTGENLHIIVEDGTVIVNGINQDIGSEVTQADIEATNGVIHKINQPLLPDKFLNVFAIAAKRYDFSRVVGAAGIAGLADTLSNPNAEYTVFAPTNAGFEILDQQNIDLTENPEQLETVMKTHVFSGTVTSDMISDGMQAQALSGIPFTFNINGDTVTLQGQTENGSTNEVQVTATDLVGTNGVVHVINSVIVPPSATPGSSAN